MSADQIAGLVFLAMGIGQLVFAPTVARWEASFTKWTYEKMLPRYIDPERALRQTRVGGVFFILFGAFLWWQS